MRARGNNESRAPVAHAVLSEVRALPLPVMGDDSEHNKAVEQAFRRHSGQIYRYLLRLSGDHHQAEELTQRVFTDAAAALSSPNPPESLLGWLYAVAERRFVDELRRRKRVADFAAAMPREPREPDAHYGRAVAQALSREIDRLPPDQRQVVVMKIFDGRAFVDIAARVGASEGGCKMRFSRAIRSLRAALEREGLEP